MKDINVVEVNNLVKYYGKGLGVDGVSFNIKKGEVFGLIGPNGAGKSTIIRSILGLIKKTSGEIKVNNKNIETNEKEIRSSIGYLPSECNYYSDMKVKDILKYSQKIYKKDNISIEELANKLKLDLTKKIEDLSYGNKKKVGIVDAILSDGDIYIFDEPTGGLDPLIQEEFFKIIEDLKLKGKTIIYSAHVLSEVQRLCDRVGIIKDGKIIKVEEINDIKEMKLKHVTLKIENKEKLNIEGAMDIKYEKSNITFSYSGDTNTLLSELVKLNIMDINIENPSLEEVFLKFYER